MSGRYAVFALITAFLLTCGGPAHSFAQEASPAAEAEMPEEVSVAILARGEADRIEPGPLQVGLARVTVPPGAWFSISPDPAVVLVLVEAGTFTFRLTTGMPVAPEAVGETPAPAGESAAGTELSLAPRESAVIPAHAAGEGRNDGAEPVVAVVLVAGPSLGELLVATPETAATGMAEEETAVITFEPLAYGVSAALPEGPVALAIGRLTVAPGVAIPPRPHPGPEVGIVEAGSLTFQTVEGPGTTILRAMAQVTTPWAEPVVETTAPGLDVTAGAGDGFFVPTGSLSGGVAVGESEVIALFGALTPLGATSATPEP